jgi:hypothetical protein
LNLVIKGLKLNLKAIILGSLVSICLLTFLDILFVGIIGGLVVGLIIADNYLEGAMNGLISSAIASGLYLLVLVTFIYPAMFFTQPVETSLLWVICIISGGFGGIAGTLIGKQINKLRGAGIKPNEDNGFLLCKDCGGYYYLMDGEVPRDFEVCECGGKLEYNKSSKWRKSIQSDKKSEEFNKASNMWKRIIAIEIGAVIIFICGLFLQEPFELYLLSSVLIAGFITGFIAGGSYQDGIFNSGGAGLIGGILVFLSRGYLEYLKISLGYMEAVVFSLIIIYVIIGLIGGLIAIFIRPFVIREYEQWKAGRSLKEILVTDSDKSSNIGIRIFAILIGGIIYFLSTYLIFVIISGFITSLIAKGSYKDSIINCAVAGLLGGICTIIFSWYFGLIENMTLVVVGLILDDLILILGGLIAISVRKRFDYKKTGVLVCDKCKSNYELSPGEKPDDFDLTCECGVKIKYAKRPSLTLLIIGYIFSFLGGIIGILIGWYLYTRKNPDAKFHGRRIMVIAIISTVIWMIINIFIFYFEM